MIKLETLDFAGFGPAMHGMRNPKNSWEKSDSIHSGEFFCLGDNDKRLALQLAVAGPVHPGFLSVWASTFSPSCSSCLMWRQCFCIRGQWS